MNNPGIVVLFGSGETLDTGRKIQRNVLSCLPRNQHVAILETPAGFQPNSETVAKELAEVFETSLKEFVADVRVIPARKKETAYSPDDEAIIEPLKNASYIVLGPGSPSYAAKQLQDSKGLQLLIDRWKNGATLVLSSAAAIASGELVLPVYEIYKAGADFYWEQGLQLFNEIGFPISVLTHWNNTDGGEKLDTTHCFMGKDRFEKLYALFPQDKPLLCIDEHTAVIFYFSDDTFSIEGKGGMTLYLQNQSMIFDHGTYRLSSMVIGKKEIVEKVKKQAEKRIEEKNYLTDIPESILVLLENRKQAKLQKDFILADTLRKEIEEQGFMIEDKNGEQKVVAKK